MKPLLAISLSLVGLAASALAPVAVAAPPTDIDSLMQGSEFQLPRLDSTYRSSNNRLEKLTARETDEKTPTKRDSVYALQFDAVADFDAAQKKLSLLRGQTGLAIYMVFDAPFYKIRTTGSYTQKAAEAAVRELAAKEVQAFVVKTR
jgi:hypothetical protein